LRRIVWTDEAVEHLEAIVTYVAVFDPAAASRLAAKLVKIADSLAEFSDRGRDAGGGMREMTTVWPYILRYRVAGDTVFILRVRHGSQDEYVVE
jgi:plasmid stabilization system protein ParE